jgi:hypothetical protein
MKATAAALLTILLAAVVSAQQADIHLLPLRGNVYLLVGAGANITLSVGKEGVLLVDTGAAPMADKVVAAITQLSKDVNAATVARPCAGLGCSGNEFASLLGRSRRPRRPSDSTSSHRTLTPTIRAATRRSRRRGPRSAADPASASSWAS